MCVRPRIDDELDNLKHIYSGLDSVLVGLLGVIATFCAYSLFQCKVAQQVSMTTPEDYAESLNVVYFPQLGNSYCLLWSMAYAHVWGAPYRLSYLRA